MNAQEISIRALTGVKWNSVATATRVVVQLASLTILARLLAPDDFGLMSMAIVVTGFAQAFADFGLSNAIIHRQDATAQQLSSLYWLNITVGFLITVMVWLSIPLIVKYYGEPRLVEVLQWSSLTFMIIALGQQFDSLLQRELRFRTRSLIQIAGNVSYLLSSVSFAVASFGVMSLVWGTLTRIIVTTVLMLLVALRANWLPTFRFRLSDLKGFTEFGLFQMGERAVRHFMSNVDYLIIGRYLGSEPLGYYTLAYTLMRLPIQYINPVVVSVAFPSFARVQTKDSLLRRGYAKILHYLSAAVFPVMAGLAVAAPVLVPLFIGEQWLPSIPIIQVFALLGAWQSLGNPLGSLLLAKGRADIGFYLNVLKLIMISVGTLIGVNWGIIGVAVAILVTMALTAPLTFYLQWHLIKFEGKHWFSAIRQPLSASLLLVVLCVFTSFALNSFEVDGAIWLITIVVTGVLAYSMSLWVLDRPLFMETWGYFGKRS